MKLSAWWANPARKIGHRHAGDAPAAGGSYHIHHGRVTLLGEDVLNASEKQLRQWRGAGGDDFQEPMTALNPTAGLAANGGGDPPASVAFPARTRSEGDRLLGEEMQIPDAHR